MNCTRFKEREVIEWLNAIQVRLGVLSLLDNPKIKFSFDVYDTSKYPLDAEALKASVFNITQVSEAPKNQEEDKQNWGIYLAVGGFILIGGLLVLVMVKRFK